MGNGGGRGWLLDRFLEGVGKEEGSEEGPHRHDNGKCHDPKPDVEQKGEEIGRGHILGGDEHHGKAHGNQLQDCIGVDGDGDAVDGHGGVGFVGHGAFAWGFGFVWVCLGGWGIYAGV